jgi:hypothetical protein
MCPVHGEDLVELLLESLHGDLHQVLGLDEPLHCDTWKAPDIYKFLNQRDK